MASRRPVLGVVALRDAPDAERPVGRLPDLDDAGRDALAWILIRSLGSYDHLFGLSAPYSMGWHQAPFRGRQEDHWQLHAHVFPPLLTSRMRKFMVGYDPRGDAARPDRDAAKQLRERPAARRPGPWKKPPHPTGASRRLCRSSRTTPTAQSIRLAVRRRAAGSSERLSSSTGLYRASRPSPPRLAPIADRDRRAERRGQHGSPAAIVAVDRRGGAGHRVSTE